VNEHFRAHWRSYLFQSLCAVLAMLLVLLAFDLQQATIATSFAATIFILFMAPGADAARPRKVIGGHAVGLIAGILWSCLPQTALVPTVMANAFAVGTTALLMTVLNVEHPPAAGTALTVVIEGYSARLVLAILVSVVLLALAHRLLRPVLRDLV
jgi:CBS-domain-containing membrane protein